MLDILIPVIYLFDSKYIITECVQICFQDIGGKFFPFKSSVPGDILEYLTIGISLFLFLKGSKRQEGCAQSNWKQRADARSGSNSGPIQVFYRPHICPLQISSLAYRINSEKTQIQLLNCPFARDILN